MTLNWNHWNSSAITSVVVIVAAAMAPAMARAADPVLPDSPNYVEKLTDEQLAVAMEQDPGARAGLCLTFASERIREIEALERAGSDKHTESLVEAWRILAFSGAIRTAQQGSAGHYDMRTAFARIAESLDANASVFEQLALTAGERGVAFRNAADLARKGAAESRESGLIEEERVARHEAMLKHAEKTVREELKARGASEKEAAEAAARLRAQCERHDLMRADLAVRIMSSAADPKTPSSASSLAARANSLVESGATEDLADETVKFLAGMKFSPEESGRVLRELGKFAEKGGSDRAASAAGAVALLKQVVERGAGKSEAADILRKSVRMIEKGVPASIVFEVMGENLKSVGKPDSKKLMAAVQAGLKQVEAVRDKLKNKAQAELDRMIEKSKDNGPDSKGKSGQ